MGHFLDDCDFGNQWEPPACGTTRIKNPKTLKRWMDLGWYQKKLDDGYIFAKGCGRFRTEVCTCSACKPNSKPELKALLDEYHSK